MARGVGMLENSGDRLQLCVKPGSQTTIEAEGELDYQNCDMLERMIKEIINTSDRVTLSLGSLNFVDSSGLRILVKAALDARKLDRTLRIDSLAPQLAHNSGYDSCASGKHAYYDERHEPWKVP
jgi:anti-anti-sigma factor